MDDYGQEEMPSKQALRARYFEFLGDFREYLMEYIRESVTELQVAELSIVGTVKIFDGFSQGKARIKNQGRIECYLSTKAMGGYRLDPGETVEFWVNSPVSITTLSGITSIGFIKS
jgi:hypothetical protein